MSKHAIPNQNNLKRAVMIAVRLGLDMTLYVRIGVLAAAMALPGCVCNFGPDSRRERQVVAKYGQPDRIVEEEMLYKLFKRAGVPRIGYDSWSDYQHAWETATEGPLLDRGRKQWGVIYIYDDMNVQLRMEQCGMPKASPIDDHLNNEFELGQKGVTTRFLYRREAEVQP